MAKKMDGTNSASGKKKANAAVEKKFRTDGALARMSKVGVKQAPIPKKSSQKQHADGSKVLSMKQGTAKKTAARQKKGARK